MPTLDYTGPQRAIRIERIGDAIEIAPSAERSARRLSWPALSVRIVLGSAVIAIVWIFVWAIGWTLLFSKLASMSLVEAASLLWTQPSSRNAWYGATLGVWVMVALGFFFVAWLQRTVLSPDRFLRLTDGGWIEQGRRGCPSKTWRTHASSVQQVKTWGNAVAMPLDKRVFFVCRSAERFVCPNRESAAVVAETIRAWLAEHQGDRPR